MKPVRIQGVLLVVTGVGILLRGPSGAGKSLAALQLMRRGHHLVADDLVEISPGPNGVLVGRPPEGEARIEIRGLGVFPARSLFPEGTLPEARIDLVADLDSYHPTRDAGRVEPETGRTSLLDVDLPTVRVAVPSASDPGLMVEVLAALFSRTGTVIP